MKKVSIVLLAMVSMFSLGCWGCGDTTNITMSGGGGTNTNDNYQPTIPSQDNNSVTDSGNTTTTTTNPVTDQKV